MKKFRKILTIALSLTMMLGVPACTDAQKSTTATNTQKAVVMVDDKAGVSITNLNDKEKKLVQANSKKDYITVTTNIKKALDTVKNISSTYDVEVSRIDSKGVLYGDKNIVKITNEIIYQAKKGEKGNLLIDKMYDSSNIDGVKSEDYLDMAKNKFFIKQENDKEFKQYVEPKKTDKNAKEGENALQVNTESSYIEAVRAFLFAAEKAIPNKNQPYFTFKETPTTYDFTFQGQSNQLVFMIDGLFGLGMNGLALGQVLDGEKEAIADITYSFSKVDYSMIYVRHSLIQTAEGDNYKSTGKFILNSKDDETKLVNLKKISALSK